MLSFRYRRIFVALLVGLAIVVGTPACERSGQAGPGETSEEDGESNELVESKGDACNRDPDCSGYLRCYDRTCQIPPAVTGEHERTTPVVYLHADDGSKELASFYVELATNRAQRRRGLMYRPRMRPDWGMLFVYPDEAQRAFWMKNTYIPLDMVFMDRTGTVVNVVHNAEPETLTQRHSEKPARFVLELNAGTARKRGIVSGTTMSVEHVPSEFRPTQ